MWRSKKFIITAIITVVALAAILGGYAVANADDQNTNPAPNAFSSLLDKVASIYQQNTGKAIDPQELSKAFTQAQQSLRTDALDKYLNDLVTKGKITQDQADQYKAWMKANPDFPIGPGFKGMPGGFSRFGGKFGGGLRAPATATGTAYR